MSRRRTTARGASRDRSPGRLADALAHYAHGQPVEPERLGEAGEALGFDAGALRSLMYELPSGGGTERRSVEPSPLTDKEREVISELAKGKLYQQIGEELGIATSTVRSHLHKAYNKLGVADRAQAVLLCRERGWL